MHEFDLLLHKALNIAEKQEAIIGEEGWFTILEFLADYRTRILLKMQGKVKSIDKTKVERVKDFISQRKNHVLKMVPTHISLQTLTERLNLDFK